MSLGLPVDQSQINSQAGTIARTLHVTFAEVKQIKYYLDSKTDGELVALGFVQGEVDTLRSAVGDLDQLRTIYEGSAALAVAKDFRTFARLLFGMGQVV